ncbi:MULTISPECIES: GNAT family N-acetyltransferase [unclassified Streptomyces]|jgi:enamine deaminase RidA (YjgF/YER057c/UK114 family)/ribosomal protein S18 acetylase RimI-like enzyme|uniref:GNAT family N-acetyltransferase n=1 Tax=unclassified Streptomyces TaxID=2593676 RepID=UPI00114D8C41|nr:GNAT family N-acetyltransferase [Streptomyces sp. SLBN-31]TQJ74763.1 enamine deaminase RidA (YjgF/YER057c/UK114 family) [Streptomyces sp. SLBN-31]
MTNRRAILSGSSFEERIGYARAVVDGEWVHVSGTTGFDYAAMTISEDVVEQAEQCLRNIQDALAQAGCGLEDVVRVRYLLPGREDFEPCWPVLRRAFGEVRPAATMMVCGLADPRMRIEIEVYARRRELRIEAVHGVEMLEEWRYVHNEVVPPAAMSLDDARGRLGRYRMENAYLGDVLVGCSTVRPPEGEGAVATVIARVLPDYRGRGFGTALYERGLAHARVLGARAVETCVLAANEDGLRFAVKRGFVETERYVLDGESDLWVDLRLGTD